MAARNSLHDFLPHVGSTFVVHTLHGMQKLNLCSAAELPRRGLPESFATPLSLLFSGERDFMLTQDTYTLDHLHLGRVEWTVVPVMARTSAPRIDMLPTLFYYEVVFN